jgi:DnaJ family protein B protein 12
MDVNKDEAIRCLDISLKHLDAGNISSARKFCLKSISLFETPRARKLLDRIDDMASSSSKNDAEPTGSSKSQSEEGTPAAGLKHRKGNGTAGGMGGEKREYTPEQAAVVKRVRSCKITAYYEILSVKKDCDDPEIKKAYRKVMFFDKFLNSDFVNSKCSSLWFYIQIRTALLEQTKHSSVSNSFFARLP